MYGIEVIRMVIFALCVTLLKNTRLNYSLDCLKTDAEIKFLPWARDLCLSMCQLYEVVLSILRMAIYHALLLC